MWADLGVAAWLAHVDTCHPCQRTLALDWLVRNGYLPGAFFGNREWESPRKEGSLHTPMVAWRIGTSP